ncbi:hypothetical protein P3S67_022241 [Capsicum chacoense]
MGFTASTIAQDITNLELLALCIDLQLAMRHELKPLEINMDTNNLINLINNANTNNALLRDCRFLLHQLGNSPLIYLYIEQNRLADSLTRKTISVTQSTFLSNASIKILLLFAGSINPQTSSWCEVCGERLESEEGYNSHTTIFGDSYRSIAKRCGGFDRAGEDIVIGFIDSGIYPDHPSFASHNTEPYGPLPKYGGTCEIDPSTRKDYCNGKVIGAQHFSEAAKAAGSFNPAMDFDSPLDGDGHGSLMLWLIVLHFLFHVPAKWILLLPWLLMYLLFLLNGCRVLAMVALF